MLGLNKKNTDGDPRVAETLDALGISYEIDSVGEYRFLFETEGGRSQQGFITSETEDFMGMEIREIYSIGVSSSGPFDARTANLLLQENAKTKEGAWCVFSDDDDNHHAFFSVKISADLDGDALEGTVHGVVAVADAMEQRLSGRDDF